jgi:hypothetical protein
MSNLRFTSELQHIIDALHKTHDELMANVAETLVFVGSTGRPYIAYIASTDIEAGEELLMDWGETTWVALCENQLNTQAITSHWYHRWHRTLRNKLLREGLAIPQLAPG